MRCSARWSKKRKKLSDRKVAVNPAPKHPAAPEATAGDATTLPDALELPTPSLRGSGATQTSTSTQRVLHTLCEVEIGRRRSRDAHAAASRDKLQSIGQ